MGHLIYGVIQWGLGLVCMTCIIFIFVRKPQGEEVSYTLFCIAGAVITFAIMGGLMWLRGDLI
jgi:hypothetical protein